MHKMAFRLARAGVVLALAVAGYFVFIRGPHLDRASLNRLVIAHTSVPALAHRKAISQSIPATTSSFAVVKNAAEANPDESGLDETDWYVKQQAPPEDGIVLVLLPDVQVARTALADSAAKLETPPSLQGYTASAPVAFEVPSVPGARADLYVLDSGGHPAGYAYALDFREGRAVVSELEVTQDTTRSTAPLVEDAQAEQALLLREEPGFSLEKVSTPVVASVVYWVIALILVAAAFFAPERIAAANSRRHERHEQRARERMTSQYRARGRRAVRRHRPPAWRQSAKR